MVKRQYHYPLAQTLLDYDNILLHGDTAEKRLALLKAVAADSNISTQDQTIYYHCVWAKC